MRALVLAALFAILPGAASAGPERETVPATVAPEAVLADSIRYALRVTDNNLMGITLTNYGFVGNNFVSRAPSMEYPLGTGYEHLVRGGLWFGARAVDDSGGFTGVVTGTLDGNQGGGSQSATEYTPAGTEIEARSKLPNSRFFTPIAVSELDLKSEYSDRPARRQTNNREPHRPMGILVKQQNYMWSFSDYAHFVVFHLTIKNLGPPLANAWVGFYSEFASGSKNLYSTWPPSSGGSVLGSWYGKKLLFYDDSLQMVREHFCYALPVPGNCNFGITPFWVGAKLLGVRPGDIADSSDKKITLQAWKWAPGDTLRDTDAERYALLSAGTIHSLTDADLLPQSGDPVELLAVGPFREINPGDSIVVDFALVGGSEVEDLQKHARTAQRAYDNDYIVPVPPPSPRMHVVARDRAIDIYWDDSPEAFEDPTSPTQRDFEGYRVYLGEDRLALNRIGQFDLNAPPNDTTGFNTGFGAIRLATPATFDGVTYQYRTTVPALKNGFKYFVAVTAYDVGNAQIEPLESGISQNKELLIPAPAPGENVGGGPTVFPNPYRVDARWDVGQKVRDHYLWFANLPERCKIKVFTLSGDMLYESDFDGSTYHGEGVRGIYDPRRELDVAAPTLSGRTFGWNMITREGQAIASGLYLFSVEEPGGGKRTVGKFLVVKSDREDF